MSPDGKAFKVSLLFHQIAIQNSKTNFMWQLNFSSLSDEYNVSMSAIPCPANSASCNTINNCYLPTTNAPNEYTGLATVNVSGSQDWRVYYYDEADLLSEIVGNSSSFDMGNLIGGSALNSSDIAAVNVNSTANNVNVFYVDQLTKALFTLEFSDGAWTDRMPPPPLFALIR